MSAVIGKVPWHLWVVGGLAVLWNALGGYDFIMTATQNAAYLKRYPPEMLDYWKNMPVWLWGLWAIGVFGGLAGSLALLLRRRIAYGLFIASFLGAALSMALGSFDKDAPQMEGTAVFSLVILGIALLLIVYARWLSRRDVLR